jgi:hypothetical protein
LFRIRNTATLSIFFLPWQISARHILVGGGGGSANTGVKNGFQIFEITTNGTQCVGTCVTT